jgi:ubiquinone/menaquinone biosynthesis C-methylase UbiE
MNTKTNRFNPCLNQRYHELLKVIPWREEMQARIARIIHDSLPRRGGRILELGFGTGRTAIAIARYIPGISIVAVDNSPIMLPQARENIGAADLSRKPRLVFEDARSYLEKTVKRGLRFDAVVASFTLHTVQPNDRYGLMGAVAGVLKPGGTFVIADKVAQSDTTDHIVSFTKQLIAFDELMPDVRSRREWIAHYLADDETRLTEESLVFIFKSAGLVNQQRVFRRRMEAIFVAEKPRRTKKQKTTLPD